MIVGRGVSQTGATVRTPPLLRASAVTVSGYQVRTGIGTGMSRVGMGA
jgi:hypothetical protein